MKKIGYFIKVKQISTSKKTSGYKQSDTGNQDMYDYFSIDIDDDKNEREIKSIIGSRHVGNPRYGTEKFDIVIHTIKTIHHVKVEKEKMSGLNG